MILGVLGAGAPQDWYEDEEKRKLYEQTKAQSQHDWSAITDTSLGNRIVQDSGDEKLQQIANDLGIKLDDSTKDALVQYVLQEKGAENAYGRSLNFNKDQYASMVEGLKKAGLNPFLAIQGLQGANMMTGSSNQGGKQTEMTIAKQQRNSQFFGTILGGILMAIAMVVAHAL